MKKIDFPNNIDPDEQLAMRCFFCIYTVGLPLIELYLLYNLDKKNYVF